MSTFNYCDVIGQQSNHIRWKIRAMEVGINRKPVCDLLLLSNWHPISYRFGVIAAYCSNFGHFAFLSPLWGLRGNVRCSSWAHWKARSWLPISANRTFFARCYGWGATGENRSKISVLKAGGSVCAKFSHRRGRLPLIIFAWIVRPMNALQLTTMSLTVFTQGNLVADFLQAKRHLHRKRPFCVFIPQMWAYRQRTMIILGLLEST